jgi:hypothetical protein
VTGFRIRGTPDTGAIGLAAFLSLLGAAALMHAPPLVVIAAAGALVLTVTLGIEALIVVALLGACGFLPFANASHFVASGVKVYAMFFVIGLGAMLFAWAVREMAAKHTWPLPANSLSYVLVVLLAYVLLVALASHPAEVPALATPFAILPLTGLAVILWLSHDDALEGLRRVLPLAVVIVTAWAIAYDAGAAGCGPCRAWVGTDLTKAGLLGPGSRLYTAGQNSLLGLFLIAFAYTLARPSLPSVALVCLGAFTIALQDSRAQYIAVLAGVTLLLIWKFGQLKVGGRFVLIAITALALLALIESPVGERAISTYTELQQGHGTGAYRLQLIHATSHSWTLFGQGFSLHTLDLGFDIDLGLPNTLLVLGYFGALLQLALLGIGIWRGIAARTAAGVTIAAVLVMVLVARPSLPLLEYGESAVMYGAVLGFAAALRIRRNRHAQSQALPA